MLQPQRGRVRIHPCFMRPKYLRLSLRHRFAVAKLLPSVILNNPEREREGASKDPGARRIHAASGSSKERLVAHLFVLTAFEP